MTPQQRQACQRLQQLLFDEVPLTEAMAVEVGAYDGTTLWVEAALAPNLNIHGSAFGGSLFAIAAVTCWGNLHLWLEQALGPTHAVLGHADIRYLAPVRERIRIQAQLPDELSLARLRQRVSQGEKAPIALEAQVRLGDKTAAVYRADYVVFQ